MPSQTRKITLDTAAILFGRGVGLLLGLVRLNYLARFLGLASFGLLNFATYFTSLFASLFDIGLSQLLTREIARDLSRSRDLLGQVLVVKVGITLIAGALVTAVALASGFRGETLGAILLTTVALIINQIGLSFLAALQAHRRMGIVSAASIINDASLSAAIILILPDSPYVMTALGITAAIAVLNLLLLFGVYTRLVGLPVFRLDRAIARSLVREGVPLALSALGVSLYTFAGPTILKYTRGEAEVGLFSAGYKLVSILAIIPASFTQVLYPVFSNFFAHAGEKLEKALADSLRVITIVSMPLAAGALIVGEDIFRALYPEQYLPGVRVLQIILVGNVLGFMAWVLYAFHLSVNRQGFLMRVSLGVGAGVVAVCYPLVSRYGFMALPFLMAGVEVVLFAIQIWNVRRLGYCHLGLRTLTRPAAAAAVMAAVLIALGPIPLPVSIPAGAVVYTAALVVLRGFGEQERAIMRSIISRVSPWG